MSAHGALLGRLWMPLRRESLINVLALPPNAHLDYKRHGDSLYLYEHGKKRVPPSPTSPVAPGKPESPPAAPEEPSHNSSS